MSSTEQPLHSSASAPNTVSTLKYVVEPLHKWDSQYASFTLLGASCACSIFTDSNNVPILSRAFIVLLYGAIMGVQSSSDVWKFYFIPIVLFKSLGSMDYFHEEMPLIVAYVISLVIGALILACLVAVALLQRHLWLTTTTTTTIPSYDNDHWMLSCWCEWGIPMATPVFITALFQLLFRFSPIGAVANPAMGLASETTLIQLASVVGEIGIVFLVGWMTSVIVGSLIGKITKRHGVVFVLFCIVVEILGGLRKVSGTGLFLSSIYDWPLSTAPNLQSTCLIIPPSYHSNVDPRTSLIERTNQRLALGDDLIVWSEAAVTGRLPPSVFNWSSSPNPGAVVAVTFLEQVGGSSSQDEDSTTFMSYNSIEFFQDGKSLGRYNKNRPVPIIEPNVQPGDDPPQAIPIQFTPLSSVHVGESTNRINVTLQVGTAICFDYDFPYLIRSAHAADLMVGPSEYWASIGYALWDDNTYRAVENGFTLFKCADEGISGAVDPYGRTLALQPTVAGNTFHAQIAVQPSVWTIYANFGGFMFGWISVALAPLYIIIVFFLQREGQEPSELMQDSVVQYGTYVRVHSTDEDDNGN